MLGGSTSRPFWTLTAPLGGSVERGEARRFTPASLANCG